MKPGAFGIDMVSGTVTDFVINSVHGWSIKPGNIVGEDNEPWGTCRDGSHLSGSGYYINAGKQGDLSVRLDLNQRGLTYTVNPSTLEHPWKLTTDLSNSYEVLHRDTEAVGIEFDLDASKIGRLDVTRQERMGAPCRTFIPAFTAMQGKRMKSTQYPDGYTFGNKTRKAVFYDKTRQAKAVKDIQDVPSNLLRCELRLFRNRTIGHTGRGVGLGTFGDVRKVDPRQLFQSYAKSVESNVFRFANGQQLALDFEGEVQLLTSLREQYERGGIRRYLQLEGVEGVVSRFGGLDTFGEAMEQAGYHPRTVRRTVRQMRDLMTTKAFVDRRRHETTVATSIDLLRNTFTQ